LAELILGRAARAHTALAQVPAEDEATDDQQRAGMHRDNPSRRTSSTGRGGDVAKQVRLLDHHHCSTTRSRRRGWGDGALDRGLLQAAQHQRQQTIVVVGSRGLLVLRILSGLMDGPMLRHGCRIVRRQEVSEATWTRRQNV
jgi:hypothetical protein